MISVKRFKRTVSACVIVLHVFVTTIVAVGPVHAQSGSADGTPLIELEEVDTGIAGDSQVFSATITDNRPGLVAELFYRFDSFAEFRQLPMDAVVGTSIYAATIEDVGDGPGFIEYYVNVRDSDNNKVTKGFAFDPLVRVLEVPVSPAASVEPAATPVATAPPPVAERRSTGLTILYVGLAVLAVGALAAVASGGGDSSDGETTAPGGPTIPVTITVDTVATGF